MPTWNWFDLYFPWIGGAAAAILALLLFATDVLRSDTQTSRWRDTTWLAWFGMVAYLLHNVEEYGVDALGRVQGFPHDLIHILHLPAYPNCPIPPMFFVAVNVMAFWIVAPVAAVLSKQRPAVAWFSYSIIIVNVFAHIVPFAVGMGYNAGTFTALVVFVPLIVLMIRAWNVRGRLDYGIITVVLMCGIQVHAVLAGSLLLFIHGYISSILLVEIQVVNPLLTLTILWNVEQRSRYASV